jgi:conjugal transfer pilus assembly protein TraE
MARMGQVTKQRNALVGLLIIVLVLNILQLFERMTVSEKIILLPPDIKKDVSVEKKRVSDSFIEEWTIYLSQLLLNVSPETINYQRDMTLRNVSPEAYSPIKAQFEEDRERLTKNRAATTFSPAQVEVSGEKLTAKITGLLSTYVGREKISEHKETFILVFTLTGWGKLQLQSFKKQSDSEEENHAAH